MNILNRRQALGMLAVTALIPASIAESVECELRRLRAASLPGFTRRRFTYRGADMEEIVINPHSKGWFICWCFYPFESPTTPSGNRNYLINYSKDLLKSNIEDSLGFEIARLKIRKLFDEVHAGKLEQA